MMEVAIKMWSVSDATVWFPHLTRNSKPWDVSLMKTAVLLDGNNIYRTSQHIKVMIDYKKLRDWLHLQFDNVFDIAWYTGAPSRESETNSIHKLLDWMSFNGYTVFTKPVHSWTEMNDEGEERKRWRANVDIEITIHAMRLATLGHVNHIILGTGDGDFVPLVEELRHLGVRTTLLSSIQGDGRACSDNLRRAAHDFIDIHDIKEYITMERNTASAA